jgi:hypothetical protein
MPGSGCIADEHGLPDPLTERMAHAIHDPAVRAREPRGAHTPIDVAVRRELPGHLPTYAAPKRSATKHVRACSIVFCALGGVPRAPGPSSRKPTTAPQGRPPLPARAVLPSSCRQRRTTAPQGSIDRTPPHDGLDALGAGRGEERVCSPALDQAREHRSFRSNGVEDETEVRCPRVEVRRRNVPA